MEQNEITKLTVDGISVERTPIAELAFQIFLKRMPSVPLTIDSVKGYVSAAEQSVEIAQLFVKQRDETLKKGLK